MSILEKDKNIILEMLFRKSVNYDLDMITEYHMLYTNFSVFFPERLQKPFERKMDYFKPIMNGEATIKIDNLTFNKREYLKELFDIVLHYFVEHTYGFRDFSEEDINGIPLSNQQEVVNFLRKTISIEEIEKNSIRTQIKIGKKRFGVGAKVTRVLSFLAEVYRQHGVKERFIGNMHSPLRVDEVIMSVHPMTGYIAGLISNSCLSPQGENELAGPIYNGYKNTAMIMSADLSWRAFCSFDFENKLFSIYVGYPRENFALQYALKKHFEKMGYTYVKEYFRFPVYFDSRVLFLGKRMVGHNWGSEEYDYPVDETLTGQMSSSLIAFVYYNEHEDYSSLDPDDENLQSREWSEYQQDYLDDYYANYSEFLDSVIDGYGETLFMNKNNDNVKAILVEVLKQEGFYNEEIYENHEHFSDLFFGILYCDNDYMENFLAKLQVPEDKQRIVADILFDYYASMTYY